MSLKKIMEINAALKKIEEDPNSSDLEKYLNLLELKEKTKQEKEKTMQNKTKKNKSFFNFNLGLN